MRLALARRLTATVGLLALLAASATPTQWSRHSAARGGDGLPWLGVRDGRVVDSEGYYVVLRGANYMGMEFGWLRHSEADFERMASWGFNVVRVPIGWAYIEPKPGVIDENYLKHLDQVVGWAKRHGLYVVLDMHQWRWSRRYGGCGMPDWLVPGAKSYAEASVAFFTNRTLWERFAGVWRLLAERYRDEPAIAAYDILNEPVPKYDLVPKSEFLRLVEEFYEYVISEIRRVDSRHIVMYMPVWGGNLNAAPRISGPNVVLTVHYYVGGTWDGRTGYERVGPDDLRRAVEMAVQLAEDRGVPLWVGEFGVGSAAYRARDWVRDAVRFFDEHGLGYAWWTYWRDEGGFGLLRRDGSEKEHIVSVLDRPYVRRSTAPVLRTRFDLEAKVFEATLLTSSGGTVVAEVYVPRRHYPNFPSGYSLSASSGVVELSFDEKSRVLRLVVRGAKPGELKIAMAPATASGAPEGLTGQRLSTALACAGALGAALILHVLKRRAHLRSKPYIRCPRPYEA